MWRYLPKRLELLLRMVLAFPKLSKMGKTSIGCSRREEVNQRRKENWGGVIRPRDHPKITLSLNYLTQVVIYALVHRAEVVDYQLGSFSLP